MTVHNQETGGAAAMPKPGRTLRSRCWVVLMTVLFLLLTLIIIGVILSKTVFKPKQPRTQLVSASLEGVAPQVVIFPALKVELNVTLNLTILVKNPNHASFSGRTGEALLLYRGDQVGDAKLDPCLIPARGSATMGCSLTLEMDKFAQPGLGLLIQDIRAGQLSIQTKTRIPGKVKFGIFRKHVVSVSECQLEIQVRDMKIKRQDCESRTKF